MGEIITNQLNYQIDREIFFQTFEVIKIAHKKGDFCNPILDQAVKHVKASAALYDSKYFYIMKGAGDDLRGQLLDLLDDLSDNVADSLRLVCAMDLKDDVILNLLINYLHTPLDKDYKISNLTGRCYLFHPLWNEQNAGNGTIPSLDVRITDGYLCVSVKTFSKREYYEDYTGVKQKEKKKALKQVRYQYQDGTMTRDPKGEYILRHDIDILREKKSEVKFAGLAKQYYKGTKIQVIYDLVSNFNLIYSRIAHIEFDYCPEMRCIAIDRTYKKAAVEHYNQILNNTPVVIVDKIKSEGSKEMVKEIVKLLQNEMDKKWCWDSSLTSTQYLPRISVAEKEEVTVGYYNICLIHEKEFYERSMDHESNDPHKIYSDCSVQHFVYEKYYSKDKILKERAFRNIVSALFYNLFIKEELRKGKIELFDWTSLHLSEDTVFVIELNDKYYGMVIAEDGSFKLMGERMLCDTYKDQMLQLRLFLDLNDKIGKNPECIIIRGKQINVIYPTDLMLLPDLELLKTELEKEKPSVKNKENRVRILNSITDLKTFEFNDEFYYLSGAIGDGMQSSLTKGCVPRKVVPAAGSELFIADYLPTLEVTFVRNKQMTVLPFPVKYLREFALMDEAN